MPAIYQNPRSIKDYDHLKDFPLRIQWASLQPCYRGLPVGSFLWTLLSFLPSHLEAKEPVVSLVSTSDWGATKPWDNSGDTGFQDIHKAERSLVLPKIYKRKAWKSGQHKRVSEFLQTATAKVMHEATGWIFSCRGNLREIKMWGIRTIWLGKQEISVPA